MKERTFWKRITAHLLVMCMLATTFLWGIKPEVVFAADSETTIYFLNSKGWENVGAYVWSDAGAGELLGSWGSTQAAASDLGNNWVQVTITDWDLVSSFHIIFYNVDNQDTDRVDIYIEDAQHTYTTLDAKAYVSQTEAENAWNSTKTTVYFLNDDQTEGTTYTKMDNVYAYVYGDATGEVLGGWPGKAAEKATEVGDNWWKVEVSANAAVTPFNIIFTDNAGKQAPDTYITSESNNYVIPKTIEQDGEEKAVVFASSGEAEKAVGIVHNTTVYFLNSKDWVNVGAYVYGSGAAANALGAWPGTVPQKATELGEKWMKVTVPAKPAFSIIFFDKDNDTEDNKVRVELVIPDEKNVYVTGSGEVWSSDVQAELAEGMGDPDKMTTVYFYNSPKRGWNEDINGYTFTGKDDTAVTLGKGWPGKAADKAPELGENWSKIAVPMVATEEEPFSVIFNDGINQTEDVLITDKTKVYVVAASEEPFASAAEAEAAAANDAYDDGCEEGPNSDLASYDVTFRGAGAALPYVTYEAEAAATNAEILKDDRTYSAAIQSEASGRQAVKLKETGNYVEFTLTEPANAMVLRYSIPDSTDGAGMEAGLSMYIDGKDMGDLSLTSKYAWVYGGYPYNNNPKEGTPHRFFDETRMKFDTTLPAGTKIKLQKDTADVAENYIIDFIECEVVAAPLTQPQNSLSVVDFGAVANDGIDDYQAFVDCIAAAQAQDKEVWIPEGTFELVEKKPLEATGVTIRGAGMWYTNLEGAGAAFKYKATSKFYDFAMTGVSTIRDDGGDLAGFESAGRATNVTIQNIWMEHIKVGVWSANTRNLVVQGCRIRNTYADGINLCSGTNDAMVRNNNLRNTGDDCIAIWPWLADCKNNIIEHNTTQAPNLANGIAIYGGAGNLVEYNHVSEIINNGSGICLGSEFETAKGYSGITTVRNNVLERCGSFQTDKKYPIGALWVWSTWQPMKAAYDMNHNVLKDCSYEGVLIDCNSEISGLTIKHIDIDGATDAIYVRGNGTGEAVIGNIKAQNYTGKLVNNEDPNFVITWKDDEEDSTGNGGSSEENGGNTTDKENNSGALEENGGNQENNNGTPDNSKNSKNVQNTVSKTGDTMHIYIWVILAGAALLVIAYSVKRNVIKKNPTELKKR